jgi:hypothetical protein
MLDLTPPRHTSTLRGLNGWSRREAIVADRVRGRDSWAESTPTRVASGTTGVRAKAAFPLRGAEQASPPEARVHRSPSRASQDGFLPFLIENT